MSRNNFKDPKTGEEFCITTFRTVIREKETVYKDKYGKLITNPKTGTTLEYIEREQDGPITMPRISKFNPTTAAGQRNIKNHFGGRAKRFDTKGTGRDTRDQKVGDFKKQIVERAREGKL